jgi:hypothetical protein
MFKELKADQYDRVRPLFQGQFAHKLSVDAAIEGHNLGQILVDDVEQPRTALAVTSETTLLVGDDSDLATIEALRQLFKESVLTGEMEFMDESMDMVIHPDTWEAKLPKLIPTHDIEKRRVVTIFVERSSSTGALTFRMDIPSTASTKRGSTILTSWLQTRYRNGRHWGLGGVR